MSGEGIKESRVAAIAGPERLGTLRALTGAGPAAVAVIELRGPATAEFLARHLRLRTGGLLKAGQVRRGELLDAAGEAFDDVLVSVHAGPPDWEVRLHLHGNPVLTRMCLELGRACGLAPGDNCDPPWAADDGIEAEALSLLPHLSTTRGAWWLLRNLAQFRARLRDLMLRLDRGEEPSAIAAAAAELANAPDVVGWFARAVRIVLIGPPNAGKSTLANALADRTVSLVSAQPGTTRDWLEVPGELAGYPVVWIDTAGLRRGDDALENLAVERTRQVLATADSVVAVLDCERPDDPAQRDFLASYARLTVAAAALNKCDTAGPERLRELLPTGWGSAVAISARERRGLEVLAQAILGALGRGASPPLGCAFTDRQREALRSAAEGGRCKMFLERCLAAR